MKVLCFNAGSSTLKAALFDGERCLARETAQGTHALEALPKLLDARPDAIGHRLVHGGPRLHAPTRVDAPLLTFLREVVPFAPLHLPSALAVLDAARARWPALPQVVCFDTHFHWDLPDEARRFALPEALYERGVRRYGFHGLSYEYIVSAAPLPRRTVVAHLGNGASLVALRDGKPIDTTMGLTPTGGVMMGTRTGDLDPGVLLFLARSGQSVEALERLVDRESGLRGVSGSASDMKALLAARATDPRAKLAVGMFVYQCRKAVGALAAALGGLDVLVFTGGIGEHAAPIRDEICQGLEHLGAFDVRVVPTDEDLVIARHVAALLAAR